MDLLCELDIILEDPITILYARIWPAEANAFRKMMTKALRRKDVRDALPVAPFVLINERRKSAWTIQAARAAGFHMCSSGFVPWRWWHWWEYIWQHHHLDTSIKETFL